MKTTLFQKANKKLPEVLYHELDDGSRFWATTWKLNYIRVEVETHYNSAHMTKKVMHDAINILRKIDVIK